MKFTVNREKFQKALQKVGSIIGSHSMLPLLSNVLIQAEEGKLKLCTTDLELRLSTEVEAEIAEAGVTTLPARKLTQLIGSFIAPEVTFDINEQDQAKICCGTAKFTLHGLPAADFPEAADFETVREVKFKQNSFKRMIGSISYAVSADDSRKVLTGILVSMKDEKLTLVATDGKRMAMQESVLENVSAEGDAIVPLKAMAELRRLLEGDEEVTINFGEKLCCFSAAGFTLTTKLIEGSFPNYRAVVPAQFKQEIEVPVSVLRSKIETVALMLSVATGFIILRFENNQLQLQGSSAEVGEGIDLIDINYEGETFEVSFNPVFLADPLRNTDAETVKIKLNDPLAPVAIEAGEGFVYIIMPLRKK